MSDPASQVLHAVSSTEIIYYQLAFVVTALLLLGLDWVMVNLSHN
jgi:hypothetical protein